MNRQLSSRCVGIDILRVIAMLSVIVLHTIYSFTVRTDFFLTKAWFVFEPLSAIARSSLALFFMISGFLVVHKNRTVTENLKITFQRIVIPFIFFSLLASFFFLFKTGKSISTSIDPMYIFGNISKFPENWLWFLEVLFVLYLLNPLWQRIFSDKSKRAEARYIVLFFFIFTSFIILIKFILYSPFLLNRFTIWIGYLCCYLYGALVKNKWNENKSRYFYISLFFLGLIMQMTGAYFCILAEKNGGSLQFAGYFIDDIAIPPLLMAIGLFNIFINVKNINVINKKISLIIQQGIQTLAILSYGIYLIHEFISQSITDMLGFNVDSVHINIYLFNCLLFAITLFGSAIITFIIARIPKLRSIIGNTS